METELGLRVLVAEGVDDRGPPVDVGGGEALCGEGVEQPRERLDLLRHQRVGEGLLDIGGDLHVGGRAPHEVALQRIAGLGVDGRDIGVTEGGESLPLDVGQDAGGYRHAPILTPRRGETVPERNEYAPGTPCWLDLAAPDLDAAKSFYGGLFGWDAHSAPGPDEETRGYSFFTVNGKMVAGFGPPGDGEPPSWRSYVSVADADETAAKVKDAGGEVLFEPLDVTDVGRMSVFRDTEGAVICAWQPKQFAGAELVNEPGTLSWNELATRDPDAAKSFYEAVFGWKPVEQDMGEVAYVMLHLDDHPVGGMLPLTDEAPEDLPPHWLPYFVVEDFESTVEKANELGGEVKAPESDTSVGKFTVLSDPAGAAFAVIELSADD